MHDGDFTKRDNDRNMFIKYQVKPTFINLLKGDGIYMYSGFVCVTII